MRLHHLFEKNVGHDTKLTAPDNTIVVDTPSDLDWYKLGQHFPTLANFDPNEFGAGGSDTVITFANKEEADKFRALMARSKVKTRDIGQTQHHPEIHTKNPGIDESKRLKEASSSIYYHGTNREFGKFEIGADKANRATNITGIYFTPHKWEAEDYGKRVIQARLHYKKLFDVQKWNDFNLAMKNKALELLAKHTTYREEWLKKAIIPDMVDKGYFAGGLRDVSGDIKREILLAGGYDAIKDGDHIAMLTTDGIEVVENVEEDYQWDDAEEGYDFENPLPIIDNPDVWDDIEELEGDIIEDWEERTGKNWRETYGNVPGGYKKFWKEVSVAENVPINKIICTEKWLAKDHLEAIQSGASKKDDLPLIHVVMGKYIATDGNHRIVAAALNGEKSIRCDVLHLPGTA